jgi:membrane-bound lytic murein transglycosylase D
MFPTSVRVGLYGTGLLSMALLFLPLWGVRPPPPEPEPAPLVPGVSALLDGRLPMTVNDQVERWIHRFLGADRGSFEAYLVREGLYGGMIRERLRARGMPEELLYLAMIESGFSAAATSKVSASGVWQFMDATAQAYGLTVDYWVDERRDPVRATDAALDYLEELYGMFGSWRLAAAAYNAGPGRVASALRHVDGRVDEEVYWEISELLPLETREYVPKILAATLLAQQAEHFGIEVEKSLPYLFEQVLVPGGTPLREIALALEVDPSLIRELNPHLVRAVTPPGASHLVRVPLGDSHRLVASLDRPGE